MNTKRNTMSVKKIRQMLGGDPELDWVADQLTSVAQMYQLYESAQHEISTKLENLDAEFEVNYNHNPIHHIDGRMKDPQSLMGKIQKRVLIDQLILLKRTFLILQDCELSQTI